MTAQHATPVIREVKKIKRETMTFRDLFTTVRLSLFVVVLTTLFSSHLCGQKKEAKNIGAVVTYVSSGSIYIDAGRDRWVAVGDTLTVIRASAPRAVVVVTTISSGSSAARVLSQKDAIAIGDSAFIQKQILDETPVEMALHVEIQCLLPCRQRSHPCSWGGRGRPK